jgi:hypothetical protein
MIGGSSPGSGWEFLSPPRPDRLWEPTQPPIQWVPGALFLEVNRPGREADHSLLSSAEVKNAWSYTSTLQYAFTAWCSIKAHGQLYLYLYKSYIGSFYRDVFEKIDADVT